MYQGRSSPQDALEAGGESGNDRAGQGVLDDVVKKEEAPIMEAAKCGQGQKSYSTPRLSQTNGIISLEGERNHIEPRNQRWGHADGKIV